MSATCGAVSGSITEFQSQIALFTFLDTVDSSGHSGDVWPVLTSAETLSAIGIDQDVTANEVSG
jgi:hypothetical protein